MGLIRGGLFFLVSVLLLVSLLAGNFFMTLHLSLKQENVNTEIVSGLAENTFGKDITNDLTAQVSENYGVFEAECETKEEILIEKEGKEIRIPCSTVEEGPEAIVDEAAGQLLEESADSVIGGSNNFNLGKYLFDKNAGDYWKKFFYYAIFISFLLIGILFFLVEQKSNLLVIVGIFILVSSIPFFVLSYLISMSENSFLALFFVFLSSSGTVFQWTFIPGIILTSLGIGLKIIEAGYKLAKLFGGKKQKEKTSKKSGK